MNSDRNTLRTAANFPYTPVFMMFKKNGNTDQPYIYRSDKFTPRLLRDFLEVTADFTMIDPTLIDRQVEAAAVVNLAQLMLWMG